MDSLFNRNVSCPICSNDFYSKKVRRSFISIEKRDSDYCSYYRGVNPLFYSIFVCPNCGFSSFEEEFKNVENIDEQSKNVFFNKVSKKWNEREFDEERTLEDAIETYKLALLTYVVLDYKKSVIAKVCLRLAWLYRYKGDENEFLYLKNSKEYFLKAYESERDFDRGDNELLTLMLIGDISKRLGEYKEAIFWFDKLLKEPDLKKKRHIELRARESWNESSLLYRKEKSLNV